MDTGKRSQVSIVDDDESIRESLPDLLRLLGFAAQAFSSAEAFLASEAVSETRCLILDVAMPGMSGPDLQHELTRRRQEIPIVFITAHEDGTIRPRLLAHGADPEAADGSGWTPSDIARTRGYTAIAELLGHRQPDIKKENV